MFLKLCYLLEFLLKRYLQKLSLEKRKKVIFLPDDFLAKYVASQTNTEIISWKGTCEVHEQFKDEEINENLKIVIVGGGWAGYSFAESISHNNIGDKTLQAAITKHAFCTLDMDTNTWFVRTVSAPGAMHIQHQ